MASTDLIGVHERADHAALPPAATDAMRRLERAFAAPHVVRAVTRFEVASARTAELSAAMDVRDLTATEFDAFEFAQDVMRESRATLTAVGQLHLIEAGA